MARLRHRREPRQGGLRGVPAHFRDPPLSNREELEAQPAPRSLQRGCPRRNDPAARARFGSGPSGAGPPPPPHAGVTP